MKNEVPIFEYHDLSDKPSNIKNFHSPYVLLKTKFFEQMRWLYQNGYQTLTIDDLLSCNIPEKSVVLTFDDGHISNYKLSFPILKNFDFMATFFIVPNFVGKKSCIAKKHILEMHKEGMKFGSHSLTHPYLLSLSKGEIIQELRESKGKIENILKIQINHFSVPYGFYNKYLVRYVEDAGYKGLVTEDFGYYKPNKNSFKVLPRITVKSHIALSKFIHIAERRKNRLRADYLRAQSIQTLKSLFGYRMYILVKSLFLKASPTQINR
ncbi:polysaccharide deacetylase family protein [Thermodesulfobacteriota bacterium]